MIKRVICMVFAIVVATSSSFAWNAESFLEKDYDQQENYDFEPVYDAPMMYSARPFSMRAASGFDAPGSFTEVDLTSAVLPDSIDDFYYLVAYGIGGGLYPVPSQFSAGEAPSGYFSWSSSSNFLYLYNTKNTLVYNTSSWNDVSYEFLQSQGYQFYYDIPLDGSSSSIQFDFNLNPANVWVNPIAALADSAVSMNLFINGSLVESYTFTEALNRSLIYNFTVPITSAKIVFTVPKAVITDGLPSDDDSSGSIDVRQRFRFELDDFIRYSLLTAGALDGVNDQAQDDINQHDQIEAQWTGSMTENFNALDLSSFTFSSGLISGFGLLTGIFNDLWHGMGGYAIVYVFPLTLAVAMLLVGRISRYASSRSSRSSDRSGAGKGGKGA